jgi:sugar phosphate isomerase/epimerase
MALKMLFSSHNLVTGNLEWAHSLLELGFDGWEVVNEGDQKLDLTMPMLRELSETSDIEFSVHGPYSDLNPASVNQQMWAETVKQLKRTAELAAEITDLVVVHPGNLSPLGFQMPDIAWRQHVECLQESCDFAKDMGVTLALENMINLERILCRTPGELFGMVEEVNRENLGMCFDVGHANHVGNLPEFLERADEYTHIHIHDNDGSWDQHLPLGKGTVDWDAVFKALAGFDGRMVIEARTLEEGVKSLEFIRKIT